MFDKDTFYSKDELLASGLSKEIIESLPFIDYHFNKRFYGLDVLNRLGKSQKEFRDVFLNHIKRD